MSFRLYLLQRLTALLMVPLIIGHLAVIYYATRNGLSAADILARTRGSIGWGLNYTVFVVAAAMHGAIGLRGVLREWGPGWIGKSERRLELAMWVFGVALALLGLRAVAAMVLR